MITGSLARETAAKMSAAIEASLGRGEITEEALFSGELTPVEGTEPGTVAEVYQQGYRINGVVLRPARVVVAA